MSEWKEYILGEVAFIKGGKRLPKGSDLTQMPNSHPYIRVRDMGNRYLPIEEIEYVPNDIFPTIKNYIVNKGDVILSIVGSVGLVSMVNKEFDKANLTENCVKILPKDSLLDNYFLYYFLKSNIGQNEINKKIVGAVQPKLPIYNINEILISLPNLPTQTAIAEILSSLDDKIELNNQINKDLEALAQALFKQWFIDFEFPNENGEPYRSSGGEMVDSELGEIPKGWKVAYLNELLTVKYGKDHKHLNDGKFPLYGSGGIMRYVEKPLYDKDSILIPRKGTLSNLFYIQEPFWSVDTMFYSEIHKPFFGKYLFHCIKGMNLASMNVGSAVPSMTTKVLNDLKIINPVDSIVVEFDNVISSFYGLINDNTKENHKLAILRDTLLPKLISGELKVTNNSIEV